jgi:outer membrane protein TolC
MTAGLRTRAWLVALAMSFTAASAHAQPADQPAEKPADKPADETADKLGEPPPPPPVPPPDRPPVPAQIRRDTKPSYDLRAALALADRNHPNVAEARAKLRYVRAQLDEAHTAPFSQFKITGGVAVAPEIAGSHVYSPNTDISLTSSLGVAWQATLSGVLPLWTFGKISNLWDAAEANVKVNEQGVEVARDLVRLEVRRAYYGLQLARDGKLLLGDAEKQLKDAETSLEAKVKAADADPIDLLKLQTFASELSIRSAEADRYIAVALAGLRFYTGVPDLDIPDAPIARPSHNLGPVDTYLAAAKLYRPELQQAAAGLQARTALVKLAQSNLFPDVGLGMSVGVSAAPEIADQLNPFVQDPANYFRYGAALVFQWNLDLLPRAAQLRQAEAKLEEMRATQRYAIGGVGAEVQVAYAEVIDWTRRLEAYEKSVGTAKKWLIRAQQGIDVGTLESKELLEPAKAYALARFNVLQATMELDLAMAKLARATGWDAVAPDGR